MKGTDGSDAAALQYGEFANDTAPESCEAENESIKAIFEGVYSALCDDINTPIALSHIFDAVKIINSAKEGKIALSDSDVSALLRLFDDIVSGVLGLKDETAEDGSGAVVSGLMDMVLEGRAEAKAAKDWARSDAIRDRLNALGIVVKDTKEGVEWTIK